MKTFEKSEVWFLVGSQHLYGEAALKQVTTHAVEIAQYLDALPAIPAKVVCKGTVSRSEEISYWCGQANISNECIGVLVWMHTFSPAKMWIDGLMNLSKPLAHLHTQYNSSLPWNSIDMDFMNLNQSAHGGREHGFINALLKTKRKIIVGHWKDTKVHGQLNAWIRAAVARSATKTLHVGRFGDNMRDVAVTEGNKVSVQRTLGYNVDGYGLHDLKPYIESITDEQQSALLQHYASLYDISDDELMHPSIIDAARQELGIEQFLVDHNLRAFTTTFENLAYLHQLPGLACQRLMEKGYGFGAEGDWKISALLYTIKTMGKGLPGGNSFMEDYTYHFDGEDSLVVGAHMLEVCPTIAKSHTMKLEVHPLGIGGKADPARLVFDAQEGPALMVTLIDLGNRLRMIVNSVETVQPLSQFAKLPVARAVWKPLPNLETSAAAWIMAGGAHHSVYSQAITVEMLVDYARMHDVELVIIDTDTRLGELEQQLRNNEVYYSLKQFGTQ